MEEATKYCNGIVWKTYVYLCLSNLQQKIYSGALTWIELVFRNVSL